MALHRRRYDGEGLLAVRPQALFGMFIEPPTRENEAEGDVAIVEVQGPLTFHAGYWCDSYDALLERVQAACSSTAKAIVLRIDSPGGDANGVFETARAIRAVCAQAEKKLVAYVEGDACSAAYALACAASEIVASESAILGSIGIIHARVDVTGSDRAYGTAFTFLASGKRKADGNPHTSITEAEIAATQRVVDAMAGTFFGLVEELRGMPAEKVAALEAGIFYGAAAVEAGLADRVQSFSSLLATLASAEPGENSMATKYEEARAALEEAAKGDGEDAKKAKAALAAMDAGDDEEEEPAAEGPGDDEEDDDEPPKDEAATQASATVPAATAGELAAQTNTLSARITKLERESEDRERSAFLASRPDLAPELVKVLEKKPLAEVKAVVNAIPKPAKPAKPRLAAAAEVPATRGDGQGDPSSIPEDAPEGADLDRELDEAMGLRATAGGVTRKGTKTTFGVMSAAAAAKRFAALNGGAE
jgi:signal peptide peptidase SppA